MDCVVVRDVIAVVAQRRGEERHEPYRVDAEFLQVVELLFKPLKITDAIPVAVMESADVHLIMIASLYHSASDLVANAILLGFQYLAAAQANKEVYMNDNRSSYHFGKRVARGCNSGNSQKL